jgi:LysR family glycine cleavage system transcriptional activator
MAHLPPLNALRAFEVSSRTSSFTLAADELCVSQGAVSRHIAHLEGYLGVKLFERQHQKVELTARGEEYARELQHVFAQIRRATDAIRSRSDRRSIKVALFPTVATQWLMPRLNRFHELHPSIDLVIRTSIGSIEPGSIEFDVVNRRGPLADPDIEYVPLFEIVLNPVCSPRLLQGVHPLAEPRDLSRQVLLHSVNRVNDWRMWLNHVGINDVDIDRGLEFDNTALACQAALAGAGVAMGIADVLHEELATSRLVQPFKLPLKTGETYGLAIRHRSLEEPAVRAFRNWVIEETRFPVTGTASTTPSGAEAAPVSSPAPPSLPTPGP